MSLKHTCKDCEKRHVGCHSTCTNYIKLKEEYAKINSEKAKYYNSWFFTGWEFEKPKRHISPCFKNKKKGQDAHDDN